VIWAVLQKLNIPANPVNLGNAVFDGLADCLDAATEEDGKQFIVFPYNLSAYSSLEDLPPPVNDAECSQKQEVDEWLQYFPQAKPRGWGGDIYLAVLIVLSMPFTKFIRKLSPWCKERTAYGHPHSNPKIYFIGVALILSTNVIYGPVETSNYGLNLQYPSGSPLEDGEYGGAR